MQAVNCLTPPTLAAFVDPLHTLLRRMEGQLTEDPELLTDQGRDRMFNSASGSLSRINKLLSLALSVQQADQEVRLLCCTPVQLPQPSTCIRPRMGLQADFAALSLSGSP